MLALAAVGGVWLISFALMAVNTAITIVIVSGRLAPRLVAAVAGAAVVAAGPVAFALTPLAPTASSATVALVQPGVVSNGTVPLNGSQILTATLSRDGTLSKVRPDLILWGESSVAFHLQANQGRLRDLEQLAAADHTEILADQDFYVNKDQHSKVAVLVGASGIEGTYTKTRLVPFGEYIPFWLGAVLADQHQQGGAGQHGAGSRGTPLAGHRPGRTDADHRPADLLRVGIPGHVPSGHRSRRRQ